MENFLFNFGCFFAIYLGFLFVFFTSLIVFDIIFNTIRNIKRKKEK